MLQNDAFFVPKESQHNLQLLQCSVESQLVVPDLDEEHLPLSHTICELPTPFVDLLLWQTCITVLNLHSSMNFNITLFFPGASLKWGSHLYTDTVTVFVHLHYAAIYSPFCMLFVAHLPTYRIMARNFDFYYKFEVFIWLTLVIYMP